MQVIRADLHEASGVGHRLADEGALAPGHGGGDLNVLVHRVGLAQIDAEQVLVHEWELTVTVQKILVAGPVAQDRGREFLPAVERIVQGVGQAPLPHILFYRVDVVNRDKMGEVVHQTQVEGPVPVGEELGLAAGGHLPRRLHDGIQPDHGVAVGLAVGFKFLHILLDLVLVAVGLAADGGDLAAGLLVDDAVVGQLLQIIRIGDIVDIPVLFPGAVLINGLVVVGDLAELRIGGKDLIPVQHGVNHDHYDTDYNADRDNPV